MPQSHGPDPCAWPAAAPCAWTFLSVAVRSCHGKEEMSQARAAAVAQSQVTTVAHPWISRISRWNGVWALWWLAGKQRRFPVPVEGSAQSDKENTAASSSLLLCIVRLTLPHLCFSLSRSFCLCGGHSNFLRLCGNGRSSPFAGPGYQSHPAIRAAPASLTLLASLAHLGRDEAVLWKCCASFRCLLLKIIWTSSLISVKNSVISLWWCVKVLAFFWTGNVLGRAKILWEPKWRWSHGEVLTEVFYMLKPNFCLLI